MNTRIDLRKYILLALLGLLLLQTACETIITIDPPEHTPQIALHAFTNKRNPDQLLFLASQTVGIFDSLKLLNEAIMELDGPEGLRYPGPTELVELRDTFFFQDTFIVYSYFLNGYNFELDDVDIQEVATYTLRASHPGLPEATATQKIPFTILPDSTIYMENAGLDQYGDPVSAIDIYWQDPPNDKNFYLVRLLRGNSQSSNYGIWLESIDPAASRYEDAIIISDQTFNGESKRLRVNFYRQGSGNTEPLFLEWSCITEDTYQYGRSLTRYWDSVDNPFITPAQLYSNINGGVGIFSLYKSNYIEIVE